VATASSLFLVSVIVLAELTAAYAYLYSLYRRPYFGWMAIAWGLNTAYVYSETMLAPQAGRDLRLLIGINALSILAFYIAAIDICRLSPTPADSSSAPPQSRSEWPARFLDGNPRPLDGLDRYSSARSLS